MKKINNYKFNLGGHMFTFKKRSHIAEMSGIYQAACEEDVLKALNDARKSIESGNMLYAVKL